MYVVVVETADAILNIFAAHATQPDDARGDARHNYGARNAHDQNAREPESDSKR